VIKLVIELERVLGELVTLAHGDDTRRMPALKLDQTQPQPDLNGTGPVVPGVSRGQHLDSQDDIDALLASVAGQSG
jgi:hypothetical protein